MARKISRWALVVVAGGFIICKLWNALNEHALGGMEICITEGIETYWSFNLITGHKTFEWGNGISYIRSGLLVAVPPGEPQPAPEVDVPYNNEDREEIIGELRALGWASSSPVFTKTRLHIEYRLYGRQYRFDYGEPYPPEAQKLFRSLGIRSG